MPERLGREASMMNNGRLDRISPRNVSKAPGTAQRDAASRLSKFTEATRPTTNVV